MNMPNSNVLEHSHPFFKKSDPFIDFNRLIPGFYMYDYAFPILLQIT